MLICFCSFCFCLSGLFRETDADIGLSPETRIISAQDQSHGLGGMIDYDHAVL